MAKFKVGDKVIGNEKANRYTFSCEGYEGEVVRFITDDDSDPEAARCRDRYGADMIICGKHPYVDRTTFEFCVRSDCFDLVERDDDGMSIVPNRIIRNGDAMIVFWQDGTKTVVKRAEGERDNDYAAFTAAFAIKLFGSNTALKKMIKNKLEYQRKKPKKMRFSVGDTVKTKDTLVCGAMYDGFTFGSDMRTECSEVVNVDDSDSTYKLSNGYWYPARMLEPATLEVVTDEDKEE